MFPEIWVFLLEEANKRLSLVKTPPVSYIQYALTQDKFFKVVLSVISVLIIVFSPIILLETFNYIEPINVLIDLCLPALAGICLGLIWRYPHLVYKYLPIVASVMLLTSVEIFISLFHVVDNTLSALFIWILIFMVPSSLFLFGFALAGRKYMRDAWRYYRSQNPTIEDDLQNDETTISWFSNEK